MDARTLEALQASIAKWEKNATVEDTEDARLGVSSCPLCQVFYGDRCAGCPVYAFDHFRCDGTPYDAAENAYADGNLEAFIVAARAEVAFLQSLLPAAQATGG